MRMARDQNCASSLVRSSPASWDMTSPVKLVGRIHSRDRLQASYELTWGEAAELGSLFSSRTLKTARLVKTSKFFPSSLSLDD